MNIHKFNLTEDKVGQDLHILITMRHGKKQNYPVNILLRWDIQFCSSCFFLLLSIDLCIFLPLVVPKYISPLIVTTSSRHFLAHKIMQVIFVYGIISSGYSVIGSVLIIEILCIKIAKLLMEEIVLSATVPVNVI